MMGVHSSHDLSIYLQVVAVLCISLSQAQSSYCEANTRDGTGLCTSQTLSGSRGIAGVSGQKTETHRYFSFLRFGDEKEHYRFVRDNLELLMKFRKVVNTSIS